MIMDKRIIAISMPLLSLFVIAFLLKGGLTGFAVFQGRHYVLNLVVDSGDGVIPEDAVIVVIAGSYSKIFRPVEIVNASLAIKYRHRGSHAPSEFITEGEITGTDEKARGYKGRFPFKVSINADELGPVNGKITVTLKVAYKEKVLSLSTKELRVK